jgi:hypothetical protein
MERRLRAPDGFIGPDCPFSPVQRLSFSFDDSSGKEITVSGTVATRLKQEFTVAQDEDQRKAASLALLRHSLSQGHRRLSLKRLEDAISCGAVVDDADLHRCAELVSRVSDERILVRLARLSRQLATADVPDSP